MSAKNVYLVIKSSYRDDKFVFRSVVCVNSTLENALRHLLLQVKARCLLENVVVRILDYRDCILVTEYDDSTHKYVVKENLFEIFKMTMGEVGSEQIRFSNELLDKMKGGIYAI